MTFYNLSAIGLLSQLVGLVIARSHRFIHHAKENSGLASSNRKLSLQHLLAIILILLVLGQSTAQAQVRSVPIRWCIVEGAPADTDPSAVGEPNTDSVAWRRHERTSEATFIPQADVTLRSSLWNIVDSNTLNFPILDDQNTSDPDHELGDILDPNIDSTEWDDTYQACVDAWEDDLEVDDIGIVAVIVRRIVEQDGSLGPFAIGWFGARRVVLEDNAWSLCGSTLFQGGVCDAVDKTFGHEVGHTLPTSISPATNTNGLRHTCNNTTNMMRQGRRDPDGDEELNNFNLNNAIDQLTNSGPDNNQCTGDDTFENDVDQITAVFDAAAEVPGCMIAGTNTPCSVQSDVKTDARKDTDTGSIDLASARIMENDDGTFRVVHELYDTIEPDILDKFNVEYFALLDTDNNTGTGGDPADLGINSTFKGADLITRVRVTNFVIPIVAAGADAVPPILDTTSTVWKFDGNKYVEVKGEKIRSFVDPLIMVSEYPDDRTAVRHTADRIVIEMPNSVRGTKHVPIRIQALARATPAQGDVIADKLDDTAEEQGAALRLRFPKFPICRVGPSPLFAGGPATVTVSGLIPEKGAHVVFGSTEVATGVADSSGDVIVPFTVPAAAAPGSHLVTVGTDNTALTADCIAEVEEAKVRYEYAAKFICGIQEKTTSLRLARGLYATTVNIHNPNAGEARLFEKLALAYPPASAKPGRIMPLGKQRLKYDEAAAIDCDYVKKKVFKGKFPADTIEGYLVIQSDKSLDVDTVHTTATLNAEGTAEDHSSVLINRIPERIIQSSTPPQKKSDLVVKDIDLSTLKSECPTGPGSCVTRVNVTVQNIGDSDVTGFTTRVTFDPRQSVTVDQLIPEGLDAGESKTFESVTPADRSCFDPDCTICTTVDSKNSIDEIDEGNNLLCRVRLG